MSLQQKLAMLGGEVCGSNSCLNVVVRDLFGVDAAGFGFVFGGRHGEYSY